MHLILVGHSSALYACAPPKQPLWQSGDSHAAYRCPGPEASLTGEVKGDKRRLGQGRWRGLAAGGLVVLLLGAYTWRTIDRNWDWEDEERLFRAALKVCHSSQTFTMNNSMVVSCHKKIALATG